MKYKQHLNNKEIYEIENFITNAQINELLSFVNLNGDDGWLYSHPGSTISVIDDSKKTEFNKILKEIEESLHNYFINAETYVGLHCIRRLITDESMSTHTDLGPTNENATMLFGIVIYLNDNFEGGELYYSEFDYKIKPKKGSLVIHKSTYPHGVSKVIDGKRYCLTCFVLGNENTKTIFK